MVCLLFGRKSCRVTGNMECSHVSQPPPPPPPHSFPSFHSRCSLATLLRLCKQPFIVNIFLVFHVFLVLHVQQFSHYLIRDTCTVAYYTYSSGIDATNKTSLTQFGSTQVMPNSAVILPFILVLIVKWQGICFSFLFFSRVPTRLAQTTHRWNRSSRW